MAGVWQLTIPSGARATLPQGSVSSRLAQFLALVAVGAMVCASITTPIITLSEYLPWGRVEQFLLPVIFLIYGWLALTGMARPVRFSGMIAVGLAFCTSIFLSLFYGAAALHHALWWRDFLEIPKALLPVAYFTIAYESELTERSLRKLLRYFSVAVFLVVLYAWAQWMNLGFTYTLNAIYSRGEHDDALFGARRVYATFGNANVLGQVMVWCFAAFALATVSRVGNRIWYGGLTLAVVVTLAMTGSRYGLIDVSLCLALILSLAGGAPQERTKRRAMLVVLGAIVAVTIWIVAAGNFHTLERYQEFTSNPYETRSFQGRLAYLWPRAEGAFVQSPFFGHGPAKTFFYWTLVDSEYLLILQEFGILGFLVYLTYFLWPLAAMWKGIRAAGRAGPALQSKLPANFLVLRLGVILVVTGLAMNVGMSTYLNMLLQGFFWLWLGLGVRAARNVSQVASARLAAHSKHESFEKAALSLGP